MSEIKITNANFQEAVLGSSKPILVDFWATWCTPCKMLSPILEELLAKHGDKLSVGKINVDEEGALAMQFKIASIPTILVFQNGELIAKTMGYMPLSALESWLEDEGIL